MDGAVLPAFFRSRGAGSFGLVGGEASVLCVMSRAEARIEKRGHSLYLSGRSASGQYESAPSRAERVCGDVPHCRLFAAEWAATPANRPEGAEIACRSHSGAPVRGE